MKVVNYMNDNMGFVVNEPVVSDKNARRVKSMGNGLEVISYTLAAMAGIFFIKGLAVLSHGRRA